MIFSTKGVTLNLVWCTEKNQDKIIWRTIGSRVSQKARVYITPFGGLSPI